MRYIDVSVTTNGQNMVNYLQNLNCQQNARQQTNGSKGENWSWSYSTFYNHTTLPNSRSCMYNDNYWDRINGMSCASSYHPGGVNALFADGSVKFIKSTISYAPVEICRRHAQRWRAARRRRVLTLRADGDRSV